MGTSAETPASSAGTTTTAAPATPAAGTAGTPAAAPVTPAAGDKTVAADVGQEDTLLGGAVDTSPEAAAAKVAADKMDADKAAAEKAAAETPIEYKPFTMPEGIDAPPERMEAFKGLAGKLKLNQEQAQELVTFQAEQMKQQAAAVEAQRQEWRAVAKKDPKHDENILMARRAVDKLADGEAKELLTKSWLGDHPAIIGLLAKAGKLLSEHSIEPGAQNHTGTSGKGIADRMFGK